MAVNSTPINPEHGWEIGYFDIETTGKHPRANRILCASIRDEHGLHRIAFNEDESLLASQIRNALESYDIIVGWNSKYFDRYFLNTRLHINRERPLRAIRHIDAMNIAKRLKQFPNHKLDTVAKALGVEAEKTPFDELIWRMAAAGDQQSLEYVQHHCDVDVEVLRQVFEILKPEVRNGHK